MDTNRAYEVLRFPISVCPTWPREVIVHGGTSGFARWMTTVGGSRVLVADDDRAVRESLDRVLRYEGYQVDLACDGAEALRQAMTGDPDAVILDVLMPAMDGLQACRSLRRAGNGSTGWTPVPTTSSASRSPWRNCWRACGPCCGAVRGRAPTRSPTRM